MSTATGMIPAQQRRLTSFDEPEQGAAPGLHCSPIASLVRLLSLGQWVSLIMAALDPLSRFRGTRAILASWPGSIPSAPAILTSLRSWSLTLRQAAPKIATVPEDQNKNPAAVQLGSLGSVRAVGRERESHRPNAVQKLPERRPKRGTVRETLGGRCVTAGVSAAAATRAARHDPSRASQTLCRGLSAISAARSLNALSRVAFYGRFDGPYPV
jgi:hypothetical protein